MFRSGSSSLMRGGVGLSMWALHLLHLSNWVACLGNCCWLAPAQQLFLVPSPTELSLLQPEGLDPSIYISQWQDGPVISPGTSLSCHLPHVAWLQWRYSNMPPFGGETPLVLAIKPLRGLHRKHCFCSPFIVCYSLLWKHLYHCCLALAASIPSTTSHDSM